MKIDGAPEVAVEACAEQAGVVLQQRALGEGARRPGFRAVITPSSIAPVFGEAGAFELAEMFRDGRPRDARFLGQRADGEFALAAEPLKQGSPRRVGQCHENLVCPQGHRNIDNRLVINW
jgi:hypothetical protein